MGDDDDNKQVGTTQYYHEPPKDSMEESGPCETHMNFEAHTHNENDDLNVLGGGYSLGNKNDPLTLPTQVS